MMTTTTAAPFVPVAVFVPAGAARVAGDWLLTSAQDAPEFAAESADQCKTAGAALHASGWATTGYPEATKALADDDFLDAPGPSIHLNGTVADKLLQARGWTFEPIRSGGVAYIKPGGTPRSLGGKFGIDYLWERDDALTLALTAEAFALGMES
jgi:hypothetical protein